MPELLRFIGWSMIAGGLLLFLYCVLMDFIIAEEEKD